MIMMRDNIGQKYVPSLERNKNETYIPHHVSQVLQQRVVLFQNNLKNQDPSYKMDLDFGDYFEGKNPSCTGIIQVLFSYLESF